jgi:hypothetical protein
MDDRPMVGPPGGATVEGSMRSRVLNWALAVLAVLVTWSIVDLTTPRAQPATPPVSVPFAFDFDPAFPHSDRVWMLAAVGRARPEALTLIGEVAGRTTILPYYDGNTWWSGYATRYTPKRYSVRLNLTRLDGAQQGLRDATVLHELGHVVGMALVTGPLFTQLLAGIPGGGECLPAPGGGCLKPGEKFADTFAKWALRGSLPGTESYGVPMPSSLDDWGAPLGELAAQLNAQRTS